MRSAGAACALPLAPALPAPRACCRKRVPAWPGAGAPAGCVGEQRNDRVPPIGARGGGPAGGRGDRAPLP
eukprot:1907457-Prymnesium_polylepis.3